MVPQQLELTEPCSDISAVNKRSTLSMAAAHGSPVETETYEIENLRRCTNSPPPGGCHAMAVAWQLKLARDEDGARALLSKQQPCGRRLHDQNIAFYYTATLYQR